MPELRKAAAVLVPLLALTACTSAPAPAPAPSASASATPLTAPSAATGEVARMRIDSTGSYTSHPATPAPGTAYGVLAACTSTPAKAQVTLAIYNGSPSALATVVITCDGVPTLNGLGSALAAKPVTLTADPTNQLTSAYAVVAPVSALQG